MEVILVEHVEGLGRRGATVKVADGYARNYLLPRRLAIAAGAGAAGTFKILARKAETREAEQRDAARAVAAGLEGVRLSLTAHANEEGHLFGSVSAAQIAEDLHRLGHEVEKRHVRLDEPIKEVGVHEVPIRLLHDVTATVTVEVVAG